MLASLYAGGVAGWFLHARLAPMPPATRTAQPISASRPAAADEKAAVATAGTNDNRGNRSDDGRAGTTRSSAAAGLTATGAIAALRERRLRLPVDEADVQAMEGGFHERRGGGARGHEAVDILAPRNTPVHAVEDGTLAKLFSSKAGGITLYQFDPSRQFCYYYAHLERYAPGLREGEPVTRGQVIGYVGTTGNAPPNTPHLHFAIYRLTDARRWWDGDPLDPYLVFGNLKTD
jgi:murein DD-endopeptidase MepM/ murein hydrolase activator NlpD